MYTPPFNRLEDEASLRAFVADARTAWLVTAAPDGPPMATLLPILWQKDTVIAHLALANPQWRTIGDDEPVLLIVAGPDAYISPTWYSSKADHGKVVPTWNYTAVHLTGTARVHRDPEWLRGAVTELTESHEGARPQPWQVGDAPEAYIEGQLRGIVGLAITITGVEGKAKLSQNRSEADRRGVVVGLHQEPFPAAELVAQDMARRLD